MLYGCTFAGAMHVFVKMCNFHVRASRRSCADPPPPFPSLSPPTHPLRSTAAKGHPSYWVSNIFLVDSGHLQFCSSHATVLPKQRPQSSNPLHKHKCFYNPANPPLPLHVVQRQAPCPSPCPHPSPSPRLNLNFTSNMLCRARLMTVC